MIVEKYIFLLKEILAFRKSINEKLSFDKKNKKDFYLILFNLRLLEITDAILLLYQNNIFSSIPILYRSAFEAFVDFENVNNDENYKNNLDMQYYVEW